MSELGKNVSGDWIRATAYFGHTPHLVPVLLFVEGDDDVPLWTEAVKPYRSKYDIRVVTNKAVNPTEENGKTKLLTMDGLCSNKLVAVDADYDLLVDNYSDYTNDVRTGQFVVNTTWYSVENILLQKTDKISLLESFSSATHELFTHHIAMIVNGIEQNPIKNFGKMLNQLHVQRYALMGDFNPIKSEYHSQHGEDMIMNQEIIDTIKSKLAGLGYTEFNVWKLMRGHNLWDTLIKQLIVNEHDQKVKEGIKEQLKEGKPVNKVKVMNDLGIMSSVREYVEHEFYYGDMSSIEMPKPTRDKLDILFPMN